MSEELKPCKCGEDINLYFRIQHIWFGRENDVYVAYCDRCQEVQPFKLKPITHDEVMPAAIKAWNTRANDKE